MPGVLYQGDSSKCSLGALSGQPSGHSFIPESETGTENITDGKFNWPPVASVREGREKILSRECSHPTGYSEEDIDRRVWEGKGERGCFVMRSLLASRNLSLSRSDLWMGRRFSLEPLPPPQLMRSRSRSQPPALPHSAPAATVENLAEVALQNALVACVLPTIQISEDASQGESNVEEGHHSLKLTSHNDTRIDGSKSPSRDSTKSSSALSMNTPPPYQHCPSGDKENHDLPTDFSDTVESDPEKEKLPGSLAETIVCPNISSHHMGRDVSNTVYGLPIDTLFTLLFTNSKFMLDLHTARKTYDVVSSPWQSNPETNQKIRQVTYTLTLPTNSFGPKVSHVTETQVISSFSKSSEIYTIDAEASNSGIPYADSFYVSNHWCLTRESANETRLAVWSQVKYKKNVWGFMKNVIDKNAFSGMEGLISDLNVSLLLEVDKTNLRRTKRRRRRAGSKSSEIVDPLLQLPSPGVKSNDSHKSTQIPSRKMTLPSVSMETDSPPVKSSVKSAALIFLCVLLAVNAFLYYRLYDLEERVVSNVSFKSIGLDSSIFKFSGSQGDDGLAEEWVQILHQQESLHAEELERWRKAVMEAADYLRKAEESLRNLHASIPSEQASKMQSLLQQLQLLQQMQEQKTAATTHKTQLSPEQGETTLEKELLPHEKIEL